MQLKRASNILMNFYIFISWCISFSAWEPPAFAVSSIYRSCIRIRSHSDQMECSRSHYAFFNLLYQSCQLNSKKNAPVTSFFHELDETFTETEKISKRSLPKTEYRILLMKFFAVNIFVLRKKFIILSQKTISKKRRSGIVFFI